MALQQSTLSRIDLLARGRIVKAQLLRGCVSPLREHELHYLISVIDCSFNLDLM